MMQYENNWRNNYSTLRIIIKIIDLIILIFQREKSEFLYIYKFIDI